MKSVRARKIILTIKLIVKDVIKLMAHCLIATILVSVCMENGWIISDYTTNISHNEFWKVFSAVFVLVPLIMFYRGITGRYYVEIKEYKIEPTIGVAKEL